MVHAPVDHAIHADPLHALTGSQAAFAAAAPHMAPTKLLERHGWNSTSFQVLEPGISFWYDPDASSPAAVAYFDTGGAWVAAGAPLTSPEALGDVAVRFVAAAKRAGRRACFFGTERRFSADPRFAATVMGEQPVWDPRRWKEQVAASRSLRNQLSRARNKGVEIRELSSQELTSPTWRAALTALKDRWLESRALAPMSFLVQVELFTAPTARRTFVALRDGELVACLAAVPIYARSGWLFEDILRGPGTPNGTTELLIDAAMTAVAAAGAPYVTLGLAPLSGPVPGWLRVIRRELRGLYDFQGVRDFRAKLGPQRWDPIELSFIPRQRGRLARALASLAALTDSLAAFAGGDFVAFGLRTLLRHPRAIAAVLAVGLWPWMALLTFAPWQALFPSPEFRDAWVTFDAGMSFMLLSLARHFHSGLAEVATVAAALDAGLGTLELVAMSLSGSTHVAQSPVLATLSLATPLLAAALLQAARAATAARTATTGHHATDEDTLTSG